MHLFIFKYIKEVGGFHKHRECIQLSEWVSKQIIEWREIQSEPKRKKEKKICNSCIFWMKSFIQNECFANSEALKYPMEKSCDFAAGYLHLLFDEQNIVFLTVSG